MSGGRPGALVVHGLTGTPSSLEPVVEALAAAGFEVAAPLLPGHGTTADDLAGRGWADWAGAVEEAGAELARRAPTMLVCGLSMGGALAAGWAAAHAEAAGLAVVNPLVDPPAESFRDLLRELLATGHPFLPGIGGDLADPGAEEDAYDRLPVAALLSLSEGLVDLRPRLGSVRCPVLIVTSRHDGVVDPISSDVLAAAVSGPVERVWLERSRHVATLDVEAAEVVDRVVAFAGRVAGAGSDRGHSP